MRRTAVAAAAAIVLAAGQAKPVQAVEMRDIAGWWLAIDDTFPKHWKSGAITPMEEVLQVNPDGRVTDRVMNFWAGSHRACLENKVCSDVPQIAVARVRVSGDKLSFSNVVASNARLDTPAGEALVRKEAITATANWTVRLDGERLVLRSGPPNRARTLVRVDLDRLRKLHAGMQLASWAPADHWRCFLGNATARDKAFAPLQAGRQTSAPDFLDRYLNLATYVAAIKSAVAIPAIDETNEERRKLLSVEPEEMLAQHFEGVLRPPAVEDRARLTAVLGYIDNHTKAMVAHNAAADVASQAKSRADAAAAEAARLGKIAQDAANIAATAQTRARAAATELQKARDAATAQTEAAKKAADAAAEAAATAAARLTAAASMQAAHEAARRIAAEQQQKVEALHRNVADLQQKVDAAVRLSTEAHQRADAAKAAATAQQQKAEAANTAAFEQQRRLDATKTDADGEQQKYLAAKAKADGQTQTSDKLAAAAREFSDGLAALQKSADEAAALLNRTGAAVRQLSDAGSDPLMTEAAREAADATSTLQAALRMTVVSLKLATAARERADAAAGAAAGLAAELSRAAGTAQQAATAAGNAAKAAETARDRAKSAADAAAKEAADLARTAESAQRAAADARDAVAAAEAARDKVKQTIPNEAREAARVASLAQAASLQANEARHASDAAAALRDMLKTESENAAKEAVRRAGVVQTETRTAAAADDAAKTAADRAGEAKVPADAASQASARARAEHQSAAAAAQTTLEAMQAVAATQPKAETLPPIAAADIAALAHVAGESEAGKKLFCRGAYSLGEPAAPESAAQVITTASTNALAPQPAADTPAGEPAKVPMPPARPSSLRR